MDYKQFLKTEINDLKTVYIFNGPNDFMKEYVIRMINKRYVRIAKTINYHTITADTEGIEDSFITPPMMDEKKIIVVEQEAVASKGKFITGLLDNIIDTNCVVINSLDIGMFQVLREESGQRYGKLSFDSVRRFILSFQ